MPKKKKTAKKPVAKVTIVRKILGKAPEKVSFYLHDGRKLESIYELVDELETMTEDAFRQYVTDVENHFANWVENVFEEKNLATELRHIRNKMDTQKALLKHLVKALLEEKKKK